MGKKVVKISKNINKNEKKQQLNSLIKVLRPKVYITDTSSFKKLVQDLTGNGSPSSSPSISVTNTTTRPAAIEEIAVPESSGEVSFDSNTSSSNNNYQNTIMIEEEEEANQLQPQQAWQHDEMQMQMQMHASSTFFQDIESWLLLDTEHPFPPPPPPPPSSSYYSLEQQILDDQILYEQQEEEVCIYDYELDGLLL